MTPATISRLKRKLADGRELHELTGAPMKECYRALIECRGDKDRAVEWLRTTMRIA